MEILDVLAFACPDSVEYCSITRIFPGVFYVAKNTIVGECQSDSQSVLGGLAADAVLRHSQLRVDAGFVLFMCD